MLEFRYQSLTLKYIEIGLLDEPTCSIMLTYPFRTFDEAKYSHCLIHFTWAALLLISIES